MRQATLMISPCSPKATKTISRSLTTSATRPEIPLAEEPECKPASLTHSSAPASLASSSNLVPSTSTPLIRWTHHLERLPLWIQAKHLNYRWLDRKKVWNIVMRQTSFSAHPLKPNQSWNKWTLVLSTLTTSPPKINQSEKYSKLIGNMLQYHKCSLTKMNSRRRREFMTITLPCIEGRNWRMTNRRNLYRCRQRKVTRKIVYRKRKD